MQPKSEKFQENNEFDFKKAVDIAMHYYLKHSKLLELKDYP